ncbi:hypothetical protein M378DRAFT_157214 [Amanita muscaria Koide BX008]|uniref:YTH domain-containing protein n=1 Tax=Amanita muscaria (strain Koide BX008) TaxID=946122 RepID=A0A0C2TRS3_AMAMK|nr:hypothetical protein M378DRAFT_157214 [Amanita muscaria Koide BX008]
MSSVQPANPPLPPIPPIPPSPPNIASTVRRHHTISASSRSARAAARESITEEVLDQPLSNDDEPLDEDWVGGVGAVGEKTSLHRQSSLPTKYHRAFGPRGANRAPKTVNSLAAIAGHEGDEEPWNIGEYSVADEEQPPTEQQPPLEALEAQASNSPLSPHFAKAPREPSPPPGSGMRRHVSLTYGAATGSNRKVSSLKRAGTIQASSMNATIPSHSTSTVTPPEPIEDKQYEEYSPAPEDTGPAYEEEYFARQQPSNQYSTSPSVGRSSPWTPGGEWRGTGYSNTGHTIDDVQRALSTIEISANNQNMNQSYNPGGQSVHPPRFNPPYPPPPHVMGSRHSQSSSSSSGNGKSAQLVTDYEGRQTPHSQRSPYLQAGNNERNSWDQKGHVLSNRSSNSNLQYGYQQGASQHGKNGSSGGAPQGQVQHPRLNAGSSFGQPQPASPGQTSAASGFLTSSIDVPTLIATKGYNPIDFDTKPAFARYFVIKSYTEDDVHKSLKYEIWSSTDPGNKRLDKAFKEVNGRGPVYLFFSVNASGHFCGMAEMLTPVDYTRSSTVWASDKWKGVFKVRWLFVRDIPNVNLRHIRLNNTQERKPVTHSRDTQELLPDAGQEMLRIFHTHPAKTSLLQDFAFYELQSLQKIQAQGIATPSSPAQSNSVVHSPQIQPAPVPQSAMQHQQHQQQHNNTFGMTGSPNPMAAYQMAQMNPMLQMQLGMGMGMGMAGMGMAGMGMGGMAGMAGMGMGGMGGMGSQFTMGPATTQAMHQSVMRHPSPSPSQGGQSGQGGQGGPSTQSGSFVGF